MPWDRFSSVQLDVFRGVPGVPSGWSVAAEAEVRLRGYEPFVPAKDGPEIGGAMLLLLLGRQVRRDHERDPQIADMKGEWEGLTEEQREKKIAQILDEFGSKQ